MRVRLISLFVAGGAAALAFATLHDLAMGFGPHLKNWFGWMLP